MNKRVKHQNRVSSLLTMNNVSWVLFAVFVAIAIFTNWHPDIFSFGVHLGGLKLVVWSAFVAFLMYSIYCSTKENIFRTVPEINKFHWGRQISIDLYLGVFVALIFIYLNEGFVVMALWAIPVLLFANLSVLLYLAIHFDSIVTKFTWLS